MRRSTQARRLFALDHNFPIPIVDALAPVMPEAELVPISRIDPRLPGFNDDWRVLLALHHHARAWDGLITTDANMLSLPRELAVLHQTKLSLIVAAAAGHDPAKATGLVLAQLSGICKRTTSRHAQIWLLRTIQKEPERAWDQLTDIARRQGKQAAEVYKAAKLPAAELAIDPLAQNTD
jgi:hypothetical protein